MIDASVRKANIAWSIRQNPTEITIRRVRKVRSGGGYSESVSSVGPLTVRLYTAGKSALTVVSTTAGTKQTDERYSLLADAAADLKADTETIDTFEAYGQRYRVLIVHPQIVDGQTCGYQVELERVM